MMRAERRQAGRLAESTANGWTPIKPMERTEPDTEGVRTRLLGNKPPYSMFEPSKTSSIIAGFDSFNWGDSCTAVHPLPTRIR